MKSDNSRELYVEACKYVIRLIGAAVNETVPPEKPSNVEWFTVSKIAKENSIREMIFPAAKKLKNPPPEEILKKWEQLFNTTSYRYLMFSMEREKLYAGLRANGLSYLPLKGINYAAYYPHPGMRSMSDNDILYGRIEPMKNGGYVLCGGDDDGIAKEMKVSQKKLVNLMVSMGYSVDRLEAHDEQFTKDVVSFEMHRCLVPENRPYYVYFKNSWRNAIRDDKDPYLYRFSFNDDYIYNIVHIYKHLTTGGIGIRVLVDMYLFLTAEYDKLDFKYISGEMNKLGIVEVEEEIRSLALSIFKKDAFTTDELRQIVYYISCGVYGNYNEHLRLKLLEIEKANLASDSKSAKKVYIKKRFEIDEETMKRDFPCFYKHKWLRPFLKPYRIIKGFFCNHKKAMAELKSFFKAK